MIRRNKFATLLSVLAFLGSAQSFAQSNCAPALPEDVCKLENKIYTATDFKNTDDVRGVMVGLKQLLISHVKDSHLIQDHIIGLVEHVLEESHEVRAPKDILAEATGQPHLLSIYEKLSKFQEQKGAIVPLDWSMPTEIMYFVFNTTRKYTPVDDRTKFEFSIYGVLKSENVVEQVQVIRYPNEIVLDRQAGIGSWNDGHLGSTGVPSFGFSVNDQNSAPKDGLYLLNVKVKNKPMVNGWFVLSKTAPTTNPTIRTPSPNEVLRTGNPTFRWVDFKSPDFKPFNQQKRLLSVYGRGPGPNDRVWGSTEVYPDASESVKLSDAPNNDGVTELKNGSYAFKARFEERWFFGGLMIGRASNTEIPFSVAK